ncbi:hypothetical protein EHI8A_021970 [Entamoeba histolytica HM-1:IMSS-B]|uniref:Uncharacterized protein n=6 Tax=Entamoeba histolytica TaxID=5759 RepID=C4LWX6_ENTH1|nr:hypothetical protein EHI_127010 [Entamoeba histolytica HM-1:IMSS]EMD48657.1 Hypothetical protein EHI5A_012310 [Entamoeba histolytica KU27]EMH72681.1 hypothetical protein EHI8A_021970 [Entamoeba histolytica HM-1:IMSS-B]EMS13919.1 hypothetical protein KM1_012470 [Entamoeba histolytica HM-3:IMSS]ENY64659.1 hypothetical protein EHI7A_003300 [Entamoeba histolytica HM-1:IMSS-A]GAT93222.1 hypothetical protein CL6EHI_127010 [Entamoeba histolytica]|eukprot:XP_651551.1 hypothetical protein EHI_127010 [Entamoeba histolytica HM-1:IMSS]
MQEVNVNISVDQYVQMKLALEKIEQMENEKKELKTKIEHLSEENFQYVKEIENLRKQLNEEKINKEVSKIELAKMQGVIYKLEGEKSILIYQVDSLKNDMSSLQVKLNDLLQNKKEEGIVFPLRHETLSSGLTISSILPPESSIM